MVRTDGEGLCRVNPSGLPMATARFALSGDGSRVLWAESRTGPLRISSTADGKVTATLAVPASQRVTALWWAESRVYYQTVGGNGVRLYSVLPDGRDRRLVHSVPQGRYVVSRSASVRLVQGDAAPGRWGRCFSVEGGQARWLFDYAVQPYAGSQAWSGDGSVVLFRDWGPEGMTTYVWRRS